MTRDDGVPAFLKIPASLDYTKFVEGMSLRDYFAGQALIGILSGAKAGNGECLRNVARLSAETAFIVADAMLEARWKQL